MHSTGAVATINCSSESPTNNNNYSEYGWCGPSPEDNYDHFIPNETVGQVVHPYYDYHSTHHHHHHQHYVNNNGSEEDCCSGPEYGYGSRSPPGSGGSYAWECPGSHNHHPSPGPVTSPALLTNNNNGGLNPRPTVKRRSTANKKERRRTQSINNAFAELRDCIPNVPADTKLSKIKTLRLATSYIAYLSEVLSGDDPSRTPAAFTAEISRKLARGDDKRKKELLIAELSNSIASGGGGHGHVHGDRIDRKTKGRTGWPQAVWSTTLPELQQ